MYLHFWESTFSIFSPLGFLGFSYQADAPQISTNPLQAHTTSDLLVSHISDCLLFFFLSTFRAFYKFIFKKLSTNFVPWLSVSYVHGNKHIYLPFIFIFCLNWRHCLTLFIVSNLPTCWGYNSVFIFLLYFLFLSQMQDWLAFPLACKFTFWCGFSLLGGIPALRVSVAVKSA